MTKGIDIIENENKKPRKNIIKKSKPLVLIFPCN
jgi:hypothetical protein